MKTIIFQGMRIHIENEAGSVRKGVDESGKPWKTTMVYPYGEIINSMGVDSDPVDVFIGPNKSAKFVYGIHQTKKDGTGFDEQKFMLGFNDAMEAKKAYFESYDIPEHFYTNVEAIPIEVFKKKVYETKNNPQLIHASKMNTTLELYKPRSLGVTTLSFRALKANTDGLEGPSGGKGIGTPVTVDGQRGRGTIVRINGRNITIRFRNGLYITRDVGSVHSMSDNYYKSRYSSVK